MDRIVVSGLDSLGSTNQEFTLTTRSIQAIISGELLMQNNSAEVGTGDAHTHPFTGDALANHVHSIPADTSATTEVAEINASGNLAVGAGGDVVGASGGTPSGTNANESTHQHAYDNPVYSKANLDIKDTWPGTPDSGDIMLVSPTSIKVFDDLDVEDVLIMVVTYEGSFIRP